jgi:hypothetical protein
VEGILDLLDESAPDVGVEDSLADVSADDEVRVVSEDDVSDEDADVSDDDTVGVVVLEFARSASYEVPEVINVIVYLVPL